MRTRRCHIVSGNDITVLWAAEAELHGKLKPPEDGDETQGERPHLWVEGWHSQDDWFSWTVELDEPQNFQLAITYSCGADAVGSELEIRTGASTVAFVAEPTSGWMPDWGMEWSSFAKHSLAGSLQLDKGVSTIEFRLKKKAGTGELPRLYTLELTPETEVARFASIAERARSGRANTDWFADAQYGLSFHWTAMSQPRRGKSTALSASCCRLCRRAFRRHGGRSGCWIRHLHLDPRPALLPRTN